MIPSIQTGPNLIAEGDCGVTRGVTTDIGLSCLWLMLCQVMYGDPTLISAYDSDAVLLGTHRRTTSSPQPS